MSKGSNWISKNLTGIVTGFILGYWIAPRAAGVGSIGHPNAYAPEKGYWTQILVKYPSSTEWEHLDYAVTAADLRHLLENYRLAYQGTGAYFRTISLPFKYAATHEERREFDRTLPDSAISPEKFQKKYFVPKRPNETQPAI